MSVAAGRLGIAPAGSPSWPVGLRAALPHGGTLPEADWRLRHRLIVALLCLMIAIIAIYATASRGAHAVGYTAEFASLLAFCAIACWDGASRKWRSVAASMGLLTAAATMVDISSGLIEMHFSFFVIIVGRAGVGPRPARAAGARICRRAA